MEAMCKWPVLSVLIILLSPGSHGLLPWASKEKAEKQISFFDLPNLKIGVVPQTVLRSKAPKIYGSDKWKKVQEGTAKRAKTNVVEVKKPPKYFGLHTLKRQRTVVFSTPPCLSGQRVDHRGYCRTAFPFQ